MGYQSMRQAIDDYIQAGITGGQIQGLATAYPQPPKITPEGDFVVKTEDPGHSMGTVMYEYLGVGRPRLLGTGGAQKGIYWRAFEVVFISFTRSVSKQSQDCGDQADIFLDSLADYILASRTAGTSIGVPAPTGAVWQWGLGTSFGADDVIQTPTMPRVLRNKMGMTQVFATTELTAIEQFYQPSS